MNKQTINKDVRPWFKNYDSYSLRQAKFLFLQVKTTQLLSPLADYNDISLFNDIMSLDLVRRVWSVLRK